jgi:hypothetical protein
MSEPFDPLAELGLLRQALARTRRETASDDAMDLAGLEQRLDQVCGEIGAWAKGGGEAEEVERVARELSAFLADLEALATELEARRHELGDRLATLGAPDGTPGDTPGG